MVFKRSVVFLLRVLIFAHICCIIQGYPRDYYNSLFRPKSLNKAKVETLGSILKRHVQQLRDTKNRKVDLVFLVDSSASVGSSNFFDELKFVRKLLADFTVDINATRVSVITFSSPGKVIRHVDHLTLPNPGNQKCALLSQEMPKIRYIGGGTYTLGAFVEAKNVLRAAREEAAKAIFLITDGFSNGGDPRPEASGLRDMGVQIFTFGIRNGNVRELFDMASEPRNETCYILDSFEEFEALARRALHEDLRSGSYVQQERRSCSSLCREGRECCHEKADCMCGTHTGKFECLCQPGYYGHGIGKKGCAPCPENTYKNFTGAGDITVCSRCPDENHVTKIASTNISECVCRKGYHQITDTECDAFRCTMLQPPTNGYFVNNKCNNVFNAACGLKCRPGYELRGSSLRICQEDSTWSGTTTECIMKTCPPLPKPKHGNMICSRNDFNYATECRFTCDNGFKLVGSRKRTCLAIAVWTGITTRCREITCQPLLPLREGTVSPASCTQGEVLFGTTCQMSCLSDYTLYGPHTKQCTPDGNWAPLGSDPNQCVDEKPPFVQCPKKLVVDANPYEPETEVDWRIPLAVDNSGFLPTLISVPALVPPAKLPIGYTTITYITEDWNKNKAKCKFYIHVVDNTPPRVDKCFSPKAVVSPDRYGNVTWEEPIFSDNSGEELQIVKTHSPGWFSRGKTNVIYTAIDKSGNNNTCNLEINVIPHPCEFPPPPVNGNRTCFENEEGVICKIFCMDGYAFAIAPAEEYFCAYDNIWRPENQMPFPDCAAKQISNDLVHEASFTFTGKLSCRDRQILKKIKSKFRKKVDNRVEELCIDGIYCSIDDFETTCEEGEDYNKVRVTFGGRKKRSAEAINQKPAHTSSNSKTYLTFDFSIEGKINSTGDFSEDRKSQKKMEKTIKHVIRTLQNDAKDGQFDLLESGRKIYYNKMQVDTDVPKFKCEDGKVLRGTHCVNCPVGTFYNVVKRKCEGCSKGTYQNLEGEVTCLVCPNRTSTSNNFSRSEGECLAQCLPGSFSSTGLERCETCEIGWFQHEYYKTNCTKCPPNMTTARRGSRTRDDCKEICPSGFVSRNGLEPCFACPRGTYQPESRKSACFECPNNASTYDIGSISLSDCEGDWDLQSDEARGEIQNQQGQISMNLCFGAPCANGGTCIPKSVGFECNCPTGYGGIFCQNILDECKSKPCQNGGSCVSIPADYKCNCAPGFEGKKCERNIDECLSSPCLQGGTCIDGINSFICNCPAGYQGVNCGSNINDCSEDPCRNGGTCVDELTSFRCQCLDGFSGLTCEIEEDECLANPCKNDATCIDMPGEYRCECLPGYTGKRCGKNINECSSNPCKNGGTCVDRINGFICQCLSGFRGEDCSNTFDVNYQLDFPAAGTVDYAMIEFPDKPFHSLTVSFWMKSDDTLNFGTPFSYSVDNIDNAFTLSDYNGFAISVNQENMVTDLVANDGIWHHIVLTWSSNRGSWKIYQDGLIMDSGWDLSTGRPVAGGGKFVIGQEQDSVGGKFSSSESFVGSLSHLNVWDQELPLSTIDEMRITCNKYKGNIIAWPDVFKGLRGALRDSPSTFCEDCPIPSNPDFGQVSYTDVTTGSTATYTCRAGFNVAGLDRQVCLATGEWEAQVPGCAKVECGFPGNIANGYTEGRRYSFDNRVRYHCYKGFRLVGKKTRYCNEYGEWEGEKPECVEITCELPLLSENTKVSSAKEKYKPRDRVLFECSTGHKMLTAHDSVTCQTDGTWDKSVPTCDLQTCSRPPTIQGGEPLDPQTEYSVGGQVTYTCDFGYTFSHTSSNKISCLPIGQWESDLPVCEIITCPEIPTVANADIISSSDSSFLSRVEYDCHEGYNMLGDSIIECLEAGEWSPEPPECRPISCSIPDDIAHGEIRGNNYKLNSILVYQCDAGYDLNTDKRSRCLQNGSWSGEKRVCNPIVCPDPGTIENGNVQAPELTFESAATYICNDGYDIKGPEQRVCLQSGEWSEYQPSCEPVDCGPPPDLPYGIFDGMPPYVFGVNVTYSCNDGYELVGNSLITCESSTFWSSGPLQCEQIKCPAPTAPDNGFVNVLGLTYTSTATYECSPGYILDGVSSRSCQIDKTWSDALPVCKATQCPQPPRIENGQLSYVDLNIGSTLTYSCDLAYKLVGSSLRTCQEDLTWSGQTPTCTAVMCPENIDIENGVVDLPDTSFGSVAVYICNEGFVLEGDDLRVCTELEQWSGEAPRCLIVECDKTASVISNGHSIGENYTYGSIVSYVCDEGYKLEGSSSRLCQANGEWDESLPICQSVKCPTFFLVNGFSDSFERDFNSVVTYSCKKGYTLRGPQSRTCMAGGVWEGDDPICVKIVCPELPDIQYGSISIVNDLTVRYSCDEGYTLVGDAERKCLESGTWSLSQPYCQIITCRDLSGITFPGGIFNQEGYTFSSTVTFECLDGYTINGESAISCEANGAWSSTIPSCDIVSCGEPGSILNGIIIGSVYTFTSIIQYNCINGYRLVGVQQRVCQADGLWSDSTPICEQIVCPDLGIIEFGRVTVVSNTISGIAQYSCIPGYELFGEETRECLGTGVWEDEDPICAPIHCRHPLPLENGEITGADYHFQKQIMYRCFEGYELVGDRERTCAENRRWNGTRPKCERIQCEDITGVMNGRVIGDSFFYGNSVTYVCNEGFELVGQATRTCTENWVWDIRAPSCQRISCGEFPAIPFATILGNETLFNTTNKIECDLGYKSVGEPIIRCLSNGKWFFGGFRCEIISCPPIESIPFGEVTGSNFEYLQKVNFICDIGYDLIGAEFVTCQASGRWDHELPVCSIVQCPDIEPIINGFTNSSANTYGSVIEYRCNRGYELVGSSLRMCLDYAFWDLSSPYCKVMSCPLFDGKITNGRQLSTPLKNYTVNSTVTFVCEEGYEMVGNEIIKCTDSGEWSSIVPSCIKINCQQPANLDHGSVIATDDLLTYVCNPGYNLIGSTERRCTNTGQWDVNAPYCIAVSCPTPAPFPNGVMLGNNFTYRHQIEYLCNDGYSLEGNDQINCESHGEWDNMPPTCQLISCGIPPEFSNGQVLGTNYTFRQTIQYICDEGYYLVGVDIRECLENGSWSFIQPYCEQVTCDINTIDNGFVRNPPSVFYAGSSISYECEPGYRLRGPSSVECDSNGQLIAGERIECIRITCPPLSSPANGVLRNDDRSVGAIVNFICDASYALIGSSELICSDDGTWNHSPPLCRLQKCPPPPDFNYGSYRITFQGNRVPDNDFIVNDRITFFCQDGFESNGSVVSQCRSDSTWSHDPPVCTAVNCGEPQRVQYAQTVGENYTFSAQALYRCDEGYNMIGDAAVVCGRDGEWIGELPQCVGECGPPPTIPFSTVRVRELRSSKKARYTCSYGAELIGSGIATCDQSGIWNYDQSLACVQIYCEEPPSIRFGSVLVASRTVGTEAKYICDVGYNLMGSAILICQENRRWEGQVPYCRPINCGVPPGPHPFIGRDFSYGGTVRYECEQGFHKVFGNSTIVCQANGQWSGIGPVCEQNSCGPVEVPPNAKVVRGNPITEIYVNHTVEFECGSNYVMNGEAILRCLPSSSWSSLPPTCEPLLEWVSECDSSVNIPNSQSLNSSYKKGDSAVVECRRGYFPVGSMFTVCQSDGTWEVPRGYCRRVYCGRPRVKDIMNIIVQGQSFFYNDEVRYLCRPGLNPSRHPPVLTCQANGRWDGEAACSAHCKLPCRNGGMCIGMNRCKCRPGYGGQQCEIPICILPCLNGGSCSSPYICTCPEGYGGSRCHKAICSQPCMNNGKCLRPNRCQCYNGFQPPFCQTKLFPKSSLR